MNELKQTLQASYTKIADNYFQANHSKYLDTHFEKFFDLVTPNGLVLDAGCGTGRDTAVFAQHNYQVIGLDLTLAMLAKGKANEVDTTLVQADLEAMPLRRGFDGIWASASLLHIPAEKIPFILTEFYNLLNQNGVFYCTVQKGHGARWRRISYQKHAKRFFKYWQAESWNSMLEQAGFEIVHEWTDATRTKDWLVRICRKPS